MTKNILALKAKQQYSLPEGLRLVLQPLPRLPGEPMLGLDRIQQGVDLVEKYLAESATKH